MLNLSPVKKQQLLENSGKNHFLLVIDYIVTGILVSKERKKLFEARVTDVEVVKFGDLIKNDSLAREEGYSNAKELESDFKKIYPDDTSILLYFK